MGNALEYDEYDGDDVDDLFGDGDGDGLLGYVDDRVPVVTENRPVVPTRTPSPVGSSGWPTVDQRLKELEACRRLPEPHPLKGVDTLRAYTMLSESRTRCTLIHQSSALTARGSGISEASSTDRLRRCSTSCRAIS